MLVKQKEKTMKNKQIDAVATLGQGYHIHSHNCGDIQRSNWYTVTRKFKKTIDVLESPFPEYSDLEFTILEKKTRCGKDGNAFMELFDGTEITMIEPNVYVVDVDEDSEAYDCGYVVDENGKQIRYTLEGIAKISCFTDWENPKIFPCAKK
jgi:hypothetical protein